MRKYVLLFIAVILALMLGVSGCSNSELSVQPLPSATEAVTEPKPTPDPLAEYTVVGPWALSASKNDIANLYTVFGTSLRDYGAGMEIKSDGSIECHVGMAGGAGSYVRDGAIINASLMNYNENAQEELELQLIKDESAVYLSCVIYDTTLYWTQDEGDMAKAPEVKSNAEYDAILELYRNALTQQLDDLALSEAGLNYMLMFHYAGEPLDNMGYCFVDIDEDGTDELLIAQLNGDEFFDKLIYDMYTLADGAPKQLFSSGERDRYYLMEGNRIYNSASSSAAESSFREIILSNGELVTSTELYYNGASANDLPWGLYVGGELTAVDEGQAQVLIAEMENAIVKPVYTAFSEINS